MAKDTVDDDKVDEDMVGEDMVGDDMSQSMLTVSEVARLLHVHSNTVRRWSDQRLLKSYRLSSRGDRRFRRQDINDFLNRFNRVPRR